MSKKIVKAKGLPKKSRIDRISSDAGMFKVLEKGAERFLANRSFKHIKDGQGNEIKVVFEAPWLLDDTDLRVYLAVLGLLSSDHDRIRKTEAEPQKTLWDRFLQKNVPENVYPEGATVRTTAYGIAKAAGFAWNNATPNRIYDALKRMSSVNAMFYRQGAIRQHMSSHMMSFAVDEDSQEISVAISPIFASAILGESRQYVSYNLEEMRSLSSPAAFILHLIFSSRIHVRSTKDLTIKMDTLVESVYGETEESAKIRNRRTYIKSALAEIENLGAWAVSYNSETGRVNVSRNTEAAVEKRMLNAERILDELNGPDDPVSSQ